MTCHSIPHSVLIYTTILQRQFGLLGLILELIIGEHCTMFLTFLFNDFETSIAKGRQHYRILLQVTRGKIHWPLLLCTSIISSSPWQTQLNTCTYSFVVCLRRFWSLPSIMGTYTWYSFTECMQSTFGRRYIGNYIIPTLNILYRCRSVQITDHLSIWYSWLINQIINDKTTVHCTSISPYSLWSWAHFWVPLL